MGPSLSTATRPECSRVDIYPPIRRGQLVQIVEAGEHAVVGIIDGVFDQHLAVSPREILLALSAGIIVIGGGSMGALRAVELEGAGVQGVGQVFEWYRAGVIIDEDELAVRFDPESGRCFCDPLVNIRASCAALRARDRISSDLASAIVETAKGLHYSLRSYNAVAATLRRNGGPDIYDLLAELREFDLKARDAARVFERVALQLAQQEGA